MYLRPESLSLLQKTVLFSNLSDSNFEIISKKSKENHLKSGEFVFHQSGDAHYFYFLVSGQIKLTIISKEGNEKVVNIIKSKMLFAEAIILDQINKYPVNAISIKESTVIAIPSETFLGMLHLSNDLCINMIAGLSKKLHFLINEVNRLSLHSASYRLVSYLLDNTNDNKNTYLSTPKHTIASRISIKPETLSRTLKQLSKSNLIKVHDSKIELLDIESLRKLIEID